MIKNTLTNKELGITYTYTPMTEEEKLQLKKDRLKSFQNLLKWYEDNKEDFIPRIFKRNVECCKEEIGRLTT